MHWPIVFCFLQGFLFRRISISTVWWRSQRPLAWVSWLFCFWKIIVFERGRSIFGCLWKNFMLCKSVRCKSFGNKRSLKSEWGNSSNFKLIHKFEKQVLPFHCSFLFQRLLKNSQGWTLAIFSWRLKNEKFPVMFFGFEGCFLSQRILFGT